MRSEIQEFIEHCSGFDIHLEPAQIGEIEIYLDELGKWNKRINLTGTSERGELLTMHVLDSLVPSSLIGLAGLLVDLGSGNGFPGLPLKIAQPELSVVFVEARRKRAAFIENVVRRLRMERAGVIWARVEDRGMAERFRGKGPITAITRAALSTRQILQWGQPLSDQIERILLMKGSLDREDLDEIGNEAAAHGREVVHLMPYFLPGLTNARNLVVIE